MCGPMSDDEWKVEDAMRTLLRAEEIKQDSELMSKVQDKMKGQAKAIKSIAGLKAKKEALEKEDDE